MIAKLTKEVTERLKAFRSLTAAIAELGPEVAAAVEGSAPPSPPPDPEVDVSPSTPAGGTPAAGTPAGEGANILETFDTLGRSLKGSIYQAVVYDRQLFDLSSEQAAQRKIRDETIDFLGDRVVGLRRTTLGQYVDPDLISLGLRSPTPSEPVAFVRNVELVTEKLGSENRKRMLGPLLFATAHDPGVHAAELKKPLDKVRQALTDIETLKRRIDAVLEKKYEVLEIYDREELRLSRMFEDLCHFAGKPGLASRVRPTVRRLKKDETELVFTDQVIDDPAASGDPAAAELAAEKVDSLEPVSDEPETPETEGA